MNKKLTTPLMIGIILLSTSILIFPQKAESTHPRSSEKNHSGNFQIHNSIVSNPADIGYDRKNYPEFHNKTDEHKDKNNTHRINNSDYKNGRETGNITKSENYFHIDKSGNTLWDGKHWALNEFPLKVYVRESSSKYFKSSYENYVSYAFNVWEKADNRIEYTFTNNSRNADIEIIFVENLGKKYEENYLGLTEYDTNNKYEIERAKIQISLLKFGKEKISAGEIKATIIHELGHAFGLGHSDSENDIMYPYIDPDSSPQMTYNELSRGDREAVQDVIDLGNKKQYVWK